MSRHRIPIPVYLAVVSIPTAAMVDLSPPRAEPPEHRASLRHLRALAVLIVPRQVRSRGHSSADDVGHRRLAWH